MTPAANPLKQGGYGGYEIQKKETQLTSRLNFPLAGCFLQ